MLQQDSQHLLDLDLSPSLFLFFPFVICRIQKACKCVCACVCVCAFKHFLRKTVSSNFMSNCPETKLDATCQKRKRAASLVRRQYMTLSYQIFGEKSLEGSTPGKKWHISPPGPSYLNTHCHPLSLPGD